MLATNGALVHLSRDPGCTGFGTQLPSGGMARGWDSGDPSCEGILRLEIVKYGKGGTRIGGWQSSTEWSAIRRHQTHFCLSAWCLRHLAPVTGLHGTNVWSDLPGSSSVPYAYRSVDLQYTRCAWLGEAGLTDGFHGKFQGGIAEVWRASTQIEGCRLSSVSVATDMSPLDVWHHPGLTTMLLMRMFFKSPSASLSWGNCRSREISYASGSPAYRACQLLNPVLSFEVSLRFISSVMQFTVSTV